MPQIDFGNNRGQNLANPKYDKDAVNFRFLRTEISKFSSGTTLTAETVMTESIQFIEPSIDPIPNTGLMWFSGGTLYVYSGDSASDLVSLY